MLNFNLPHNFYAGFPITLTFQDSHNKVENIRCVIQKAWNLNVFDPKSKSSFIVTTPRIWLDTERERNWTSDFSKIENRYYYIELYQTCNNKSKDFQICHCTKPTKHLYKACHQYLTAVNNPQILQWLMNLFYYCQLTHHGTI